MEIMFLLECVASNSCNNVKIVFDLKHYYRYSVARVRSNHQIGPGRQDLPHLFGPRILPHRQGASFPHRLQYHGPARPPSRNHRGQPAWPIFSPRSRPSPPLRLGLRRLGRFERCLATLRLANPVGGPGGPTSTGPAPNKDLCPPPPFPRPDCPCRTIRKPPPAPDL